MNYKKILCDFQNFIKEYLSLEHKQRKRSIASTSKN